VGCNMIPKPEQLIADPLFQINMLLWLTQPLPDDAQAREAGVAPFEIKSLLHTQGYVVYAIAPMLTIPGDVRLAALGARLAIRDGVRPDAVLCRERDLSFLFVECKASSFSPDSSSLDFSGSFKRGGNTVSHSFTERSGKSSQSGRIGNPAAHKHSVGEMILKSVKNPG